RLCSCLFFFSSRRRHTRSKRDWSSDVCSSDLPRRIPSPRPDPTHSSTAAAGRLGSGPVSLVERIERLLRPEVLTGGPGSEQTHRSEERRVGKEWRARGRAETEEEEDEDSKGRR